MLTDKSLVVEEEKLRRSGQPLHCSADESDPHEVTDARSTAETDSWSEDTTTRRNEGTLESMTRSLYDTQRSWPWPSTASRPGQVLVGGPGRWRDSGRDLNRRGERERIGQGLQKTAERITGRTGGSSSRGAEVEAGSSIGRLGRTTADRSHRNAAMDSASRSRRGQGQTGRAMHLRGPGSDQWTGIPSLWPCVGRDVG